MSACEATLARPVSPANPATVAPFVRLRSLLPQATSTAVVNNQTVTLTWSQPPGEVVQSYEIEAGSAPGLANLARISTGSSATSFMTPGVPAGKITCACAR